MRVMRLACRLLSLCVLFVVITTTGLAHAWIENHVLNDDITIHVQRDGTATVEHRISFHTNGNVRFRKYEIRGIDADAEPLPNSYMVPLREALSNSLESATPVNLQIVASSDAESSASDAVLRIEVADEKGLRRGRYLIVLRYKTDLKAAGRLQRDGAFTRVTWVGPRFDDGFDNARATFVVPRSPTPPRAFTPEAGEAGDDAEEESGTFLTEVRRGSESDEVELLRTYSPKGEGVRWRIQVDPRAMLRLPEPESESGQTATPFDAATASRFLPPWRELAALGGGLLLFGFVLTWLKSREVRTLAAAASAEMPPVVPLPGWLRAIIAGLLLVAGVGLQLVRDQPVLGSVLVVIAAVMAAHRAAKIDHTATMRGPGRWLAVSESEAFHGIPRPSGGWLDWSTLRGKALLLVSVGGLALGAWFVAAASLWHGVLLSGNVVFFLAVFGTGLGRALPPDMTVEPARFLRLVLKRLRKRKDLAGVRIVPRIRLPNGGVDPDEVRLLVAPRVPLRGFTAIEIGLTYALGMGARVAMPEVLLRVVADSPCDQAVAAISRVGRVTSGRKRDERVVCFAPRFPTVRMTAEIAAAVAIRVLDRDAASRTAPAESDQPAKKRAA